MKLWIDDIRTKPDDYDLWARTCDEAFEMLDTHHITFISFDHDSGEEDFDFIKVAYVLEKLACFNEYHKVEWTIHSANPVGAAAIEAAMKSADRYWALNEMAKIEQELELE